MFTTTLSICTLYALLLTARAYHPHLLTRENLLIIAPILFIINTPVSIWLVYLRIIAEQNKGKPSAKETAQAIAEYREAYRTAPIGSWSQAVGLFCDMMDEHWDFNPDHTGIMIDTGYFRGVRGEMPFIWREVTDYTIACQEVKTGRHDEENEDEDALWITIHYDFTMVPTDFGYVVGMYEVNDDGAFCPGFWYSNKPLRRQ